MTIRHRHSRLLACAGALALTLAPALPASAATTWSTVTSPNRGTYVNYLDGAAATSTGNAWAVGHSYDLGIGSTRTLAVRWNGSQWSITATPNPTRFYSELYAVDATSTSDAWAVGGYATGQSGGGNSNDGPHSTLAQHWNGTSWTTVSTPNPGVSSRNLYGVKAFSPSNAWAVGYYYETINPTALTETMILHWNGTAWTQVSSPSPANYGNSLRGVSGSSPTDVWAVGSFTNRGESTGATHPLAVHWNGTSWSQVPVPHTGFATLNAVTAISANDVWAVGSENGYASPVTFHWNGTAWSEVATPALGGSGNNVLYSVTGLASGQVWAAGYQSTGSAGPQPLIERWDGTAWRVETTPSPELGGALQAIAAVPGSAASPVVWGAGYQTTFGDEGSRVDRTLIFRGTGS
jgi:hypothetical protein